MKHLIPIACSLATIASSAFAGTITYDSGDAISAGTPQGFESIRRPISNRTLFDSALPGTKIHPVVMYQRLPSQVNTTLGKVPMGGDFQVYALQFEIALNERLSVVATKDGYIDFNPDYTFKNASGFANLEAGLKYAFLLDPANGTAVSGTATFELPTGNREVFQGEGDGAVNLILSGLKLQDAWQFAGAAGVHLPFSGQMSTTSFVSAHASYEVCPLFIPLVEVNWFHVLSPGNGKSSFGGQPGVSGIGDFEGFDLINFGAANSSAHRDLVTAAVGFRSRLSDSVDVGVAYELPLTSSENSILKDRVTVDLVWNF